MTTPTSGRFSDNDNDRPMPAEQIGERDEFRERWGEPSFPPSFQTPRPLPLPGPEEPAWSGSTHL